MQSMNLDSESQRGGSQGLGGYYNLDGLDRRLAATARGKSGRCAAATCASAFTVTLIILAVIAARTGSILSGINDLVNSTDSGGSGSGSGSGASVHVHTMISGLRKLSMASDHAEDASAWLEVWLPETENRMVLGIPEKTLSKPFIVTNLISQATGFGDHMLHTMADYATPVYTFERAPDGLSIDIKRLQSELRTSNKEYEELLAAGGWSGYSTSFRFSHGSDPRADPEKLYIDITAFALEEGFGIGGLPPAPRESRLVAASAKLFPRNLNMELQLHSLSPAATPEYTSVGLYVSLALLRDDVMIGRMKDDRIGYFTTKYIDIGAYHRTDVIPAYRGDNHVSLINRWRLEKKDPSCTSACEPKVPIVYHIDPTVPAEWRPWFKKGVEVWQDAFAKLGFKDTPRAILEGDADWPKDYHAGDIRYSSISFSISQDMTFSVGPSTVDPRSGEILDADIGFAQEWVGAWTEDLAQANTGTHAHRHKHDEHHDHDHDNHLHGHSHINSRHTHCRRQSLKEDPSFQLAKLALDIQRMSRAASAESSAVTGAIATDIIGSGLADVTAHEVGHTLGLRHNFKGSSFVPLTKLQDRDWTGEYGLSGSVMDYIPINIANENEDQGYFFTGNFTVGQYDKLAIAYGYTVFNTKEETGVYHPQLEDLAQAPQAATPPVLFASDGDAAISQDPFAKRYDMTDDPVRWNSMQMDLAKNLRKQVYQITSTWAKNVDYTALWNAEHGILWNVCKSAKDAATHIGGMNIFRQHRQQLQQKRNPVVFISSQEQTKALDVIQRAFTEPGLLSPTVPASFPSYDCSNPDQESAELCLVSRSEDSDFSLSSEDLNARRIIYLKLILDVLLDKQRLKRVHRGSRLGGGLNVTTVLSKISSFVWGDFECGGVPLNKQCTVPSLAEDSRNWEIMTYFVHQLGDLAFYNISDNTQTFGAVEASARLQLRVIKEQLGNVSTSSQLVQSFFDATASGLKKLF